MVCNTDSVQTLYHTGAKQTGKLVADSSDLRLWKAKKRRENQTRGKNQVYRENPLTSQYCRTCKSLTMLNCWALFTIRKLVVLNIFSVYKAYASRQKEPNKWTWKFQIRTSNVELRSGFEYGRLRVCLASVLKRYLKRKISKKIFKRMSRGPSNRKKVLFIVVHNCAWNQTKIDFGQTIEVLD